MKFQVMFFGAFVPVLMGGACSFEKSERILKNLSEKFLFKKPEASVPNKTLEKFLCPREKQPTYSRKKTSIKSKRQNQLEKLRNTPLDLVVEDIRGEMWDLYCYREKKNLVINLWATWCPPCVEELFSLSQLAEKAKKETLVLALSTEPKETLSRFIKRAFPDLGSSLKIVSLPEEKLQKYFPKDLLPVTYIFNKKGKLVQKEMGARDWNQKNLLENIKNL